MLRGFVRDRGGLLAQDTQSQRIREDSAVFQHLMSRPMESCSARGAARFGGLHLPQVYGGPTYQMKGAFPQLEPKANNVNTITFTTKLP